MRKPQQAPSLNALFGKITPEALEQARTDKYIDFARRASHKYYHWDKMRFVARSEKLDPEVVWLMEKLRRVPQLQDLPLRGYKGETLKYSIPPVVQEELMRVDQQLAGEFTTQDEQPLPGQKERFIISALREEAIASSMLEGAVTTRVDAKEMLRKGRKPKTHGERMVLNNYQAINFIRDQKDVDLSPEFLLELQKILTENTLEREDEVGRFRTASDDVTVVDDRDGEIMHTPPPAEELDDRLARLCDFANQDHGQRHFIHPVVKACVLHFQVGFDHPFCDGNGRTARALFYWSMLRSGYWLFEYLPISRLIFAGAVKYARAFLYTETDDFDATYFLAYKMSVIQRARSEFNDYVARKMLAMSQARRLYAKDTRLNHRQREVVLQ
ncbi:MAG: Fic family protein, partial [Planctomycetota bacterium]